MQALTALSWGRVARVPYNRCRCAAVEPPYAAPRLAAASGASRGERARARQRHPLLGLRAGAMPRPPSIAVHGYRGEHHGLEPVIAHLHGHPGHLARTCPGFGESTPLTETDHAIRGLRPLAGTRSSQSLGLREAAGHPRPLVRLDRGLGTRSPAGLRRPTLILLNPIAAPALKGPQGVHDRGSRCSATGVGAALPERVGSRMARQPGHRAVHERHARADEGQDAPALDPRPARHLLQPLLGPRHRESRGSAHPSASDVSEVAGSITRSDAARRAPRTTRSRPSPPTSGCRRASRTRELVILQGVGHLIHYEKPREAAAPIDAFLGSGSVASAAGA